MENSYFTPQNAMKRFFYIHGRTSDSFYPDSGSLTDLKWMVFKELQRNGYECIIFYDRNMKLYCYDHMSYELMLHGRKEEKQPMGMVMPAKRHTKLKMGSWKVVEKETSPAEVAEKKCAVSFKNPDFTYKMAPGAYSGIRMQQLPDERLHSGLTDNLFVLRQIKECLGNADVRTAVVINDANDFAGGGFGQESGKADLFQWLLSLSPENKNIMVFIFPEQTMESLIEMMRNLNEEGITVPAVHIPICHPNALELRNMLYYFHMEKGLKIRLSEIIEIAGQLQYYMLQETPQVGTKDLYHYLEEYIKKGKQLTLQNCYEVLGNERRLSGEEQLERLIGMENVKQNIRRFKRENINIRESLQYLTSSRVMQDRQPPERDEMMHVLLTGSPGTGKTTVAKLLGQLFHEMGYLSTGHVVLANRNDLVAGYVGQTALKTQAKVMEALGGILFIDEAYALKRNEDDNGDFGQEAIDTLVKAMTDYAGQFIVVAAGYKAEMKTFVDANPGLGSRFRLKLHIDDYTPEEMQKILELKLREKHCRFSKTLEEKLPDFCENWVDLAEDTWGNGREAENLANELELNFVNDAAGKTEEVDGVLWKVIEERHIPVEKQGYLKPVSKMREEVLKSLNELVGLAKVKEKIEALRLRMLMGDLKGKGPGHYIFSGNPGTGKTTVARYMGAIFRNLGLLKKGKVVEYTAGDLVTKVQNGMNRAKARTFEEIVSKAIDGVLFIDEAYQLRNTNIGQQILEDLVPFMENNRERLCVILAGYSEDMEDILKQNSGFASRFSATIEFENYTGEELQQILLSMLDEGGYKPDEEYREYSLRALTRYVQIHGKEKEFGNARYVRGFYIPQSLDMRNRRLVAQYGENVPEEEKKRLTGADIPSDLIKYTKDKLPEPDTRTAAEKLEELIGYRSIKEELKRLLASAKYRREDGSGAVLVPERLHWILKGNPGTGKTTIAKLVGEVYRECGLLSRGHCVKTTRSDLVAGYEGQTAIKIRKKIEEAMGGVLFIDEAYSLVEGDQGSFGREALNELVEAMEARNGEFAVIAAGYPSQMDDFKNSNPGFSSRFKEFVLEDYTSEELHQIFLLKCRNAQFSVAPELDRKLDVFFSNYKKKKEKAGNWGNGREVENLLGMMQQRWFENPVKESETDEGSSKILTEVHIPEELGKYLKGKKQIEKKETALESIQNLIGFDEVKKYLEELLELKKASREEDMEDLVEDLTFHWALKGNPGTGKTTIAKLIGKVYKEIGLLSRGHCVKTTRADLVGEYQGHTAVKTRKKIEEAMGGVLFIDEAYMLKRGEDSGREFGQEAIDTLLEAMSDRNGEFAVVVAGYPREMDVFLDSNPGFMSRFSGNIFELKDYTAEELTRIFESMCKKRNTIIAEDLKEVIPSMFSRMIRARLRGWANAREVENLEKKMRKMWAKNRQYGTDEDGSKIRIYSLEHLPEEYRKYLQEGDESIRSQDAEFRIPASALLPPAEEFQYEKDSEMQEQGLVLIQADMERGKSFGSGFMVTSDGYLLTCNHVVKGSSNLKVRLKIPGRSGGDISWHRAHVIRTDERLDVAMLKIDVLGYPALSIRALGKETQKGENIYLLGYPFGRALSDDISALNPSLFQGSVSSIQKKDGYDRINTDMEGKRGCSGGPVFSKVDGTVIGIFCGSQTQGDSRLIEEINYVLPIKYIWEKMIKL